MMRLVSHVCLTLAALLVGALCASAQSAVTSLCPRIEIECPARFVGGTSTLIFNVKLDPPAATVRLAFDWVVSRGAINNGQGTPTMTLNFDGGDFLTRPTVTVGVRGLPAGCPASASCTVPNFKGCGRPLDEYGDIAFEDAKARLDNLAIELQNSPDFGGHFICYGGRIGREGEARRRCERAKNYLVSHRGIEASRIVIEDGGYREKLTVAFWAVPPGAIRPAPAPTVAASEVTFIKPKPKQQPRRR